MSGLTPYVRGLLLSRIPRSSFIFIPLNLDLVAVSIPPVSFSLSKANKHSWGKRRIARIRIEIPPISMGCTFSQVHGRSSQTSFFTRQSHRDRQSLKSIQTTRNVYEASVQEAINPSRSGTEKGYRCHDLKRLKMMPGISCGIKGIYVPWILMEVLNILKIMYT